MIDMFPNIFDIGNPGVLALMDELVESKVISMVEDIHKTFGQNVSAEFLCNAMNEYDIDYPSLPDYLKNVIDDEFDVY